METSIAIVPNGYGALKYIDSLNVSLSKLTNSVHNIILPGQNGKEGTLTVLTAAQTIHDEINKIYIETNKKVTVLTHCSSMLPLLQLASCNKKNTLWDNVQQIVLYAYLAKPMNHVSRFLDKASKYNVDFGLVSSDIAHFSHRDYVNVPVDVHVIHARTPMNRLRADRNDLKLLQDSGGIATLQTPTDGYDIADLYQSSVVEQSVERNILPLLS